MNVSSTHIVSSPFDDVDLPLVDIYSFITSDVWQYPDRDALVSTVDYVVLCKRERQNAPNHLSISGSLRFW